MLEAALSGLAMVLQWPAIGYLGLGILLGIYFGAVPGLSGLSGMAILLPFTFGMDPVSAFACLLGMYAITTTSDSIPAILIGVPPTAAAQATVLDGYPMAKRGEAARAFGAAFTCSAIGGVLGAFFMGLSIPIVRPLVLSFAKPEFFMLGLLGLTMVGSLSGGSILRGLLGAGIGLMFGMVGYADQVGIPRYWLGSTYLLDGLSLVPVVLGLFALPELASLAVSRRSISDIPRESVAGGLMMGVRDSLTHWWLLLRSSLIGIYIGILPALGAAVADWVAYGHAVQTAKDKSQFGKGDVRGVIAPEAANNSVKGGDLVPTVAFGIPGSPAMSILLGAFLIQGLTPGPEMLTTKLDITFSMMWMLVIANVIAALVLMAWTRQLQRIIFIPGHLVVPAIVLFVFMGAWSGGQIGDWVTMLVFGVIGVAMKEAGWPRAPFVLGFILGPIMENSLHLSVQAYGMAWLTRPIVLVLGLVVLGTLALAIRTVLRDRAKPAAERLSGEANEGNRAASLLVAAGAVLMFGYAIVGALDWPGVVSRFPLTVAIPSLAIAAVILGQELTAWRAAPAGRLAPPQSLPKLSLLFAWLTGMVGLTVLIGQPAALTIFVFAFLMVWGRTGWRTAAIYAAAGLAFLYVVFDQLVGTLWYPALLFR